MKELEVAVVGALRGFFPCFELLSGLLRSAPTLEIGRTGTVTSDAVIKFFNIAASQKDLA